MRSPLLFLLALLSACSVVNREHCGNQDGDATCIARDPSRPHCSICVAENDGCLAQAPADGCGVASTGPGSTGTASTGTDVAPTTGTSTSTGPGTSTTDPSTTSTTGSTTGTGSTTTGETTDTTATTTDTTATTAGPICGNGVREGDEVCDGKDLADQSCAKLLPDKWGGGTLGCNDCASFNDSECCIGVGQKCDPLVPDEACCGGLKCEMDVLPSVESHCQNP